MTGRRSADGRRRLPAILPGTWYGRVAVAAGLILIAAAAVPLVATSSPAFFAGYSEMERSYTSLQESQHAGLACDDCHAGGMSALALRLAATAEFYRGLAGRPDTPVFLKMAKPTREACIRCHEQDWSDEATRTMQVPHPAHLRVASEKRDCVGCHKWTAHEEAYMERHKSMPFSGVCVSFGCHVGTKKADECRFCHHALAEDQAAWRSSHRQAVQERGAATCLEVCHEIEQCRECHTTGRKPDVKGPKRETGFQALQRAHAQPGWLEKHGREALANESQCLYCHVSKGECENCHARRPAFHGPHDTWLVEHKKLAKDERRCLACHEKPWCDDCHAKFKEQG